MSTPATKVSLPAAPADHAIALGMQPGKRYRPNYVISDDGLTLTIQMIEMPRAACLDYDANGNPIVIPQPLTDATAFEPAGAVAAGIASLTAGSPDELNTFLEAYNRFLTDESVSSALNAAIAAEATARAAISWSTLPGKPTLATVATSGSYPDLSNKPTIYALPSSGTTAHYLRGDNTWAILPTTLLWSNLINVPLLEPINVLGNSTGVRRREFDLVKTSVNCNALNSDVAVWTGLPSRWRLEGLYCFVPAGQPSLLTVAKIALYTGSGASGTNLLASTLIGTDTGLINDFTITSGVSKAIQTSSACYLRCTVALGLPATANFVLIVQDLTDN